MNVGEKVSQTMCHSFGLSHTKVKVLLLGRCLRPLAHAQGRSEATSAKAGNRSDILIKYLLCTNTLSACARVVHSRERDVYFCALAHQNSRQVCCLYVLQTLRTTLLVFRGMGFGGLVAPPPFSVWKTRQQHSSSLLFPFCIA